MSKEKLTLGIATLALIVALGVAIFGGKTIVEKVNNLAGVTSYDEVGSNDVATGKVRLTSSSTATGLPVHRLSWLNETGRNVLVPAPLMNFRTTGTASSSGRWIVGTSSTSGLDGALVPDYDMPTTTPFDLRFPAGRSGVFLGTSTNATTTSLTEAVLDAIDKTTGNYSTSFASTTAANTILVRNGEYLQAVLQPGDIDGGVGAGGSTRCSSWPSTAALTGLNPCELATSTNFFTNKNDYWEWYFEYFFDNPDK